MRKNVATKLVKLFKRIEQTDDWQPFIKQLKKCNESELREAFGDNKNMLINIVYCGFQDAFKYVSQDFIRQMFIDLQKDDKEYLQDQVWQLLYGIGTDIYNDNRNTLMYFAQYADWIFKVGHYIRYCNPKDERLIRQYRYVVGQACLYMNTDKLFEYEV